MIKKILYKFLDIHPDAISFQGSMDLTGLPIVTLYQGEKKIYFLLDTGSTDCVINESCLKEFKHKMLDVVANHEGLEGIKQQVKACLINVYYKDKGYECPCLIRNMSKVFNSIKKETGVTVHGILGSKFFNEFKYVLDFDKLIAYSKE